MRVHVRFFEGDRAVSLGIFDSPTASLVVAAAADKGLRAIGTTVHSEFTPYVAFATEPELVGLLVPDTETAHALAKETA